VVDAMTAVAFAWHRPKATDEAVRALASHAPDTALLAGGGSLAILLNERAVRPAHVIDLNEVDELAGIRDEGDGVWIGAMTRVWDVESSELLGDRVPLLCACARTVADPSLRHRVTVGGGLAYADSSGSLPTALLALEATVHAAGPSGPRDIPIDELFVAGHETSLRRDELITGVTVPAPAAHTGMAWLDLDRRHLAYSLVSAAAVVAVADGQFELARVAMAGIAPTPRRLRAVERALDLTDEAGVRAAAAHAVQDADPIGDLHASADYRRRMAVEFCARAVLEAMSRC
jgi:aerobic carbon-monoxide dehydrogenase medium subunit